MLSAVRMFNDYDLMFRRTGKNVMRNNQKNGCIKIKNSTNQGPADLNTIFPTATSTVKFIWQASFSLKSGETNT